MSHRFSLIAIFIIALGSQPVVAALEDGIEAYNRGDYALALEEFTEQAAAGDGQAMLLLGLMHDNGLGTPKDAAQAFEWYRRAAGCGNPRAQFNVGEMLDEGRIAERDREAAVRWYGEAAGNGYAEAQYRYGLALMRGDGIDADAIEAWKWLDIAAASGVDGSELAGAARDELGAAMSAAELREARERGARWRESFEQRERKIEI